MKARGDLNKNNLERDLIKAVSELDEDKAVDLARSLLERGETSLFVLDLVQQGVVKVSKLYDEGKYFIADLIMAGLIFKEILMFLPFNEPDKDQAEGKASKHQNPQNCRVIFATVERDIHDIGKNIAGTYFQSRGVEITDLGVDVSAEDILATINEGERTLLFLSGLLSAAYESMKKTVALLDSGGLRDQVTVVVCGAVNQAVMEYAGADFWVETVVDSYGIYEKLCNGL